MTEPRSGALGAAQGAAKPESVGTPAPRAAATRPPPRPPYAGEGGFLLLDKPLGISSFLALRPVKKLFHKAKVGHAGTLDPAATGLLIAGVAGGTRLLEYLEGMPKTYAFTAVFGFTSDSYDLEGAVAPFAGSAPPADAAAVESALAAFRGNILQAPPAYSAIKVGGERAYALARAGEEVVLPPREVEVHSLELTSFAPASNTSVTGAATAHLVATCSKGTYVRSLVHDLGRALGCGAVTGSIRRLAIGAFRVEDAVAPDALTSAAPLLPLAVAVGRLPAIIVPEAETDRFLNGQSLTVAIPPEAKAALSAAGGEAIEARAQDDAGRLLAIADLTVEGRLNPRKVLARREPAPSAAPVAAAVTPAAEAEP